MMENSETEAQQSFHSPPRRRRSTFFERRDSLVTQDPKETIISPIEECEKYNEHMQRYYDDLLKEKELWKKEVKNRRNKYHDLRQQCQLEAKSAARSKISYSTLTNDDIEFLKGKPNLTTIAENQTKLHDSVKVLQALYNRSNDLDDMLIRHCEGSVNAITNYILEHSTVEND